MCLLHCVLSCMPGTMYMEFAVHLAIIMVLIHSEWNGYVY